MRADKIHWTPNIALAKPRLWLVQFLGNSVLGAAFAIWLLIPEAHVWELVLSLLLICAIAAAALALHGGALNYFSELASDERVTLKAAILTALRNVAAIAVWAVVFYFVWAQLDLLDSYLEPMPNFVQSELSPFVRSRVSLDTLDVAQSMILFALRWAVLPGLFLPWAAQAARFGFGGFGRDGLAAWWRAITTLKYWLALIFAAPIGVLEAERLMNWHPAYFKATLHLEMVSAAVRFLLAYVIALASWLAVASVAGSSAVVSRIGRDPLG